MEHIKNLLKWLKWTCIILISEITGKTTVDFLGSTYIVSGNIVKKVR